MTQRSVRSNERVENHAWSNSQRGKLPFELLLVSKDSMTRVKILATLQFSTMMQRLESTFWLATRFELFLVTRAGTGNLVTITGRMNCALSLADRKINCFYPKILPLGLSQILASFSTLNWVTKILLRALSNVHAGHIWPAGRRFPTPVLEPRWNRRFMWGESKTTKNGMHVQFIRLHLRTCKPVTRPNHESTRKKFVWHRLEGLVTRLVNWPHHNSWASEHRERTLLEHYSGDETNLLQGKSFCSTVSKSCLGEAPKDAQSTDDHFNHQSALFFHKNYPPTHIAKWQRFFWTKRRFLLHQWVTAARKDNLSFFHEIEK